MPPDRPNEEQVRELMRQYGDEPPEAPQCKRCAKPMFISEMTNNGCEFGCRCGATAFAERERPFDADVVALCEDWLRMRLAIKFIHGGNNEANTFMAIYKAREIIGEIVKEQAHD